MTEELEWSTRFNSGGVIIFDYYLMSSYAQHDFVISFLYTLEKLAVELPVNEATVVIFIGNIKEAFSP